MRHVPLAAACVACPSVVRVLVSRGIYLQLIIVI